jgi:AcrR family transcriptional regulator
MEPRRTQAARSKATRDQIAQAALTVFALKGYAAASMEDIALASGSSKGGVYHHFPTKSHILRGVVERLEAQGWLVPPITADGPIQASAIGRILIDTWAEASRDDALRAQLQEACRAVISSRVDSPDPLGLLLATGSLVQMLTRPQDADGAAVAARVGRQTAA